MSLKVVDPTGFSALCLAAQPVKLCWNRATSNRANLSESEFGLKVDQEEISRAKTAKPTDTGGTAELASWTSIVGGSSTLGARVVVATATVVVFSTVVVVVVVHTKSSAESSVEDRRRRWHFGFEASKRSQTLSSIHFSILESIELRECSIYWPVYFQFMGAPPGMLMVLV
jgi:hypothetical protein